MKKSKLQTLMLKGWVDALYPYFQTQSFKNLSIKIAEARLTTEVYPAKEDIFRVFNETALADVKVVLLGDSPSNVILHDGTPVSNGRAYGVNTLTVIPGSSVELHKELGEPIGFDYSLQHLVDQGVLLLNTKLTCSKDNNHPGWYHFTKAVLQLLNSCGGYTIVFRGESSKQFKSLFTNKTITIVDSIKETDRYLLHSINWTGNTNWARVEITMSNPPHRIGYKDVDGNIFPGSTWRNGEWVIDKDPSDLSATTQYFNQKDIKIIPYDGQEEEE